MNALITTIIIGIGLSMDAFSLAFSYGTLNISHKKQIMLSTIVGLFHFFMPLLGLSFGMLLTKKLFIDFDILITLIFIIIGIDMITTSIKQKEEKLLITLPAFFLFGLSVSIDSFTTGIGLKVINDNYLQVALIFCFFSLIFTYFGLILGTKLNQRIGRYAPFFGGLLLIILGIYNYLY